jgi:hypothetical protein
MRKQSEEYHKLRNDLVEFWRRDTYQNTKETFIFYVAILVKKEEFHNIESPAFLAASS